MLLKCLACRSGSGSSCQLATPSVMSANTLETSAFFILSCPEGACPFDPQRGRTAGDSPVSVCFQGAIWECHCIALAFKLKEPVDDAKRLSVFVIRAPQQ